MLMRAAELSQEKSAEAVHRQTLETSCNEQWAEHNVYLTRTFVDNIASQIERAVSGEILPSIYGFTSLVFKEAVGPILIISP